MDIIEANGGCVMQTTWHTTNGNVGKGNCNRGGCEGERAIPAGGHFHIKAAFAANGWMTVSVDGVEVAVANPTPNADAASYVKETLASAGAIWTKS